MKIRPLIFGALLAAATGPAPSQEQPTLNDVITGTAVGRVPVAVPDFTARGRGSSGVAEAITRTLRSDLEASGYFVLVPQRHYALVEPDPSGAVPYQGWLGLGASALVDGTVEPDGERFRVEARLYDTRDEKMIMGRRYRGEEDLARRIAHRIADEIVRYYTGNPGISQSKIAFAARVGEAKEIFLMDYDGKRIRRLTRNGSLNLSPCWSPDGERIALTSFKDGFPAMFVLDRDGKVRRISMPEHPLNIAPDWSPDGATIAYSASVRGNTDLFLLDLETETAERLTSHRSIECCPSWSPTGRELAFTSDRTGSPQVYLMDAEGTNVRRLTPLGRYNDSAAWSPRGDRIAFVSRLEGHFHLQVIDLASRQVTRLTFGRSNHESPAWSPDGRHLVFMSDRTRTGHYEIYRIAATGGEPVRLTRSEGASSPAWSR